MKTADFRASLSQPSPPPGLSIPVEALWWDGKGHWAHAHSLVDSLDTQEGMAVHAYLHRKEGDQGNAAYWYSRAGKQLCREPLDAEWLSIVRSLPG